MLKTRIIAFYLPQYYPTPLNNKYYGEGFTEWTNVGKAKPMFRGHYQPRVPTDLGYYDLRMAEIREKQAQLARYAGIEGFCYYHYWFGKGHVELERPLNEVVASSKPDFPFCLCWANQSWYAKFWNHSVSEEKPLIAEQLYDDSTGIEQHFRYLLPVFKDKRYIKVDGKLLFMIYRPLEYPGIRDFMNQWQTLARAEGLPGFYFIGQAPVEKEVEAMLALGMDGVNLLRLNDVLTQKPYSSNIWHFFSKLARGMTMTFYRLTGISTFVQNRDFGGALPISYERAIRAMNRPDGVEKNDNVFPSIVPNWDHSPRSGRRAYILHHSTPELWGKHVREILNIVKDKNSDKNLVFLKSWNEWGEGNYMEPDSKYGTAYCETLKKEIEKAGN